MKLIRPARTAILFHFWGFSGSLTSRKSTTKVWKCSEVKFKRDTPRISWSPKRQECIYNLKSVDNLAHMIFLSIIVNHNMKDQRHYSNCSKPPSVSCLNWPITNNQHIFQCWTELIISIWRFCFRYVYRPCSVLKVLPVFPPLNNIYLQKSIILKYVQFFLLLHNRKNKNHSDNWNCSLFIFESAT